MRFTILSLQLLQTYPNTIAESELCEILNRDLNVADFEKYSLAKCLKISPITYTSHELIQYFKVIFLTH